MTRLTPGVLWAASLLSDGTQGLPPIEWRYICGSGFCECGGCVL